MKRKGIIKIIEYNSGKREYKAYIYGYRRDMLDEILSTKGNPLFILLFVVMHTILLPVMFSKKLVKESNSDIDFKEEVHLKHCREAIVDYYDDIITKHEQAIAAKVKSVKIIKTP